MGKQLKNIAVFASGNGTNFSAICSAVKHGSIKANLALVICDQPQAGVIQRVKDAGIKLALVRREDFSSKKDFESGIIGHLKQEKIDLIVMAGFMRLLSPEFVAEFKGRMINIHPSLLPAFKGTHAIKDAFLYGAKVTGVTVHFVDELLDHGPIILQAPVAIEEQDTLETLEEKIHRVEHRIYPEAVQIYLDGRLKIDGRAVRISSL